ncbi:MAG: thioredoxin domain-containing protein [Planctomycetes bacterium]|nr:thioredoxin domain-containing protein [Planctomycetota bacterium]
MAGVHKSENAPNRFVLGLFLLAAALVAALIQVLDALGAMTSPGCGLQSGCHAAASSVFGRLPVLEWPLSYVGTAWFAGLLVVWILTRGDIGRAWGWVVRVGVAASLFYAGVLAGRGFVCPYCIAVHVANVAFLVMLETRAQPLRARGFSSVGPALATVGAIGIALALSHAQFADSARAQAEHALQQTTAALQAGRDEDTAKGFVGRHARGKAQAGARIVVFTDYQCEDCHKFEAQLDRVLAADADTSVAIRHFPMCASCNPHALDLHPNACWAARAAEAAAIVGGDSGFWRMSDWLFARRGSFTEGELDKGLVELGFDRRAFLAAMHSEETLARVREDIDIGMRIGLTSTPMIFINGVELRGFEAPNALERALAEARAQPRTAVVPPSARERFLNEWRTAPRVVLPVDMKPHVLGAPDAPVKIVLFGDYQEPFTCAADIELRALTLNNPRVSYAFRAFPVNKACNSVAELDLHPRACLAALGAEAAGVMQGEDGFWALHDWIMTHRTELNDGTLTQAAEDLGMPRADYWNALLRPEIEMWLAEDVRAAKALDLKQIPLIYIDGRRVTNWKSGEESLLGAIVAEALR